MIARVAGPFLAIAIVIALTPAGAAYALTAAEIVDDGIALDGTSVTLTGEAIGEDLRADADHRWINLRSDGTGVGVYITNDDANVIETFGSSKSTGDIITVIGKLNVACDTHAGEFDIHADRIELTQPGQAIDNKPEWWKAVLGLLAAGFGFVEWRLLGKLRNREEI
ncbi:MAG: hypothetical protein CVT60_02220 [Actinobacteria bacterium HGW-Actinobacteria-10]|jgi:hypothetical protein|nr:MAG: hypothetical protein CVT60_02220 [Actinobacteria bacterium HGW-Actinobacteria-10]